MRHYARYTSPITRRPLDTNRLHSLRRNSSRATTRWLPCVGCGLASCECGCAGDASLCFCGVRYRPNLEPYSTSTTNRYRSNPYRLNPDEKWGPTLYNPLEDTNHKFKDDSHYQKTIAKLRRNPEEGSGLFTSIYSRNPHDSDLCPDCGLRRNPEEGSGLFTSIYSRRNPDYALRAASGVNTATGDPGQALYRSLFARRNPPMSPQNASNSPIGQGLYKSIFSRRRNPIRRRKFNRYGV